MGNQSCQNFCDNFEEANEIKTNFDERQQMNEQLKMSTVKNNTINNDQFLESVNNKQNMSQSSSVQMDRQYSPNNDINQVDTIQVSSDNNQASNPSPNGKLNNINSGNKSSERNMGNHYQPIQDKLNQNKLQNDDKQKIQDNLYNNHQHNGSVHKTSEIKEKSENYDNLVDNINQVGVSFQERNSFDDQLKKLEYIFEFWESKLIEMHKLNQNFYQDETSQIGLYLVDNRDSVTNGRRELYSGLLNKDEQKHGFGMLRLDNNDLQRGEFLNDELWGVGKLEMSQGDSYFGEWEAGRTHGFGVQLNNTIMSRQVGHWSNDNQHGQAEETFGDGSTYKGHQQHGLKTGKGKFEWQDGSSQEGDFLENKIHGQGKQRWADGKEQEGQWFNDLLNGFGEFRWPDGRFYKGNQVNNLKSGQGEFHWPDGRSYQGEFKNGKQEGQGKLIKDGNVIQGIFERGNIIKELDSNFNEIIKQENLQDEYIKDEQNSIHTEKQNNQSNYNSNIETSPKAEYVSNYHQKIDDKINLKDNNNGNDKDYTNYRSKEEFNVREFNQNNTKQNEHQEVYEKLFKKQDTNLTGCLSQDDFSNMLLEEKLVLSEKDYKEATTKFSRLGNIINLDSFVKLMSDVIKN